jgi:hypothetical protein
MQQNSSKCSVTTVLNYFNRTVRNSEFFTIKLQYLLTFLRVKQIYANLKKKAFSLIELHTHKLPLSSKFLFFL